MRYRASLADGTEFDRSDEHVQAAAFKLNSVIKDWREALSAMTPRGQVAGFRAAGFGLRRQLAAADSARLAVGLRTRTTAGRCGQAGVPGNDEASGPEAGSDERGDARGAVARAREVVATSRPLARDERATCRPRPV
jgi:hypothetical protein